MAARVGASRAMPSASITPSIITAPSESRRLECLRDLPRIANCRGGSRGHSRRFAERASRHGQYEAAAEYTAEPCTSAGTTGTTRHVKFWAVSDGEAHEAAHVWSATCRRNTILAATDQRSGRNFKSPTRTHMGVGSLIFRYASSIQIGSR